MNLRSVRERKALALLLAMFLSLVVSNCSRPRSWSELKAPNIAAPQTIININTADADELKRLPNVGDALAQRIVEFRQKHGRFRRVEHLLLIQGISEKRFREIRPLVKTE